jgi:tetratricopeptide (TPR) repeat protein
MNDSQLDPRYYPSPKDGCPCGAGNTFRDCCRPFLVESASIEDAAKTALGAKEFGSYLVLQRAELARYLLRHRRHTPTLCQTNPALGQQLLLIDIDAVFSLVESLFDAHVWAKKQTLLLGCLARLELAIDDSRWKNRIAYFRASAFYLLSNDRDSALAEFETYAGWRESEKESILQFGLDLTAENLGSAERREVCERIIAIKPSIENQVQYRTLVAMDLLLDDETALAVKLLRELHKEIFDVSTTGMSEMALYLVATSLVHLSFLENEDRRLPLLEKARGYYRTALERGSFTKLGLARLHALLGESYEIAGDYDAAMKYYVLAGDHSDRFDSRYGLARMAIERNEPDRALFQLRKLAEMNLSTSQLFDVNVLLGSVAIAKRCKDLAREVMTKFSHDATLPPALEKRAATLLSDLETILRESRKPQKRASWRRALSFLSKHLELKPNIGGFGINVNALIDGKPQGHPTTDDGSNSTRLLEK